MDKFLDLTTLPLHEILLANGYKIDREKSSMNNPCLVNDNGEKLVISKKGENYLYFNVKNDDDRGNIISYARFRNINIKDLIHNYDKNIELSKNKDYSFFKHKELDCAYYAKAYSAFAPCDIEDNLLLKRRGFDMDFISSYQGILKQDEHNNIIILHYKLVSLKSDTIKLNENEIITICGYTKRLNLPITKDKDGNEREKPLNHINYGNKGIECLNLQKDATSIKQIVLTESIIDSLSFMQMKNFNPKETLLLSTAGSLSDTQEKTLKAMFDKVNARIYLAFDKDEKGLEYTKKIETLIKEENARKYGKAIPINSIPIIYKPFSKDCNDDLSLLNITKLLQLTNESYNKWANYQIYLYKMKKTGNERALLLHQLRKADSLRAISEDNKEQFNTMLKHKAVKSL